MRFEVPDHPDIERCLRTGYPSWMQERDEDGDEDDYLDDEEDLEDYYE